MDMALVRAEAADVKKATAALKKCMYATLAAIGVNKEEALAQMGELGESILGAIALITKLDSERERLREERAANSGIIYRLERQLAAQKKTIKALRTQIPATPTVHLPSPITKSSPGSSACTSSSTQSPVVPAKRVLGFGALSGTQVETQPKRLCLSNSSSGPSETVGLEDDDLDKTLASLEYSEAEITCQAPQQTQAPEQANPELTPVGPAVSQPPPTTETTCHAEGSGEHSPLKFHANEHKQGQGKSEFWVLQEARENAER